MNIMFNAAKSFAMFPERYGVGNEQQMLTLSDVKLILVIFYC